MEVIERLAESDWLRFQVLASVLYFALTAPCLMTNRRNVFCFFIGFPLLSIIALATPFIALSQPVFLSFTIASVLLWTALFWYEAKLIDTFLQGNPGGIAYVMPMTAWFFSLPAAGVVHLLAQWMS